MPLIRQWLRERWRKNRLDFRRGADNFQRFGAINKQLSINERDHAALRCLILLIKKTHTARPKRTGSNYTTQQIWLRSINIFLSCYPLETAAFNFFVDFCVSKYCLFFSGFILYLFYILCACAPDINDISFMDHFPSFALVFERHQRRCEAT